MAGGDHKGHQFCHFELRDLGLKPTVTCECSIATLCTAGIGRYTYVALIVPIAVVSDLGDDYTPKKLQLNFCLILLIHESFSLRLRTVPSAVSTAVLWSTHLPPLKIQPRASLMFGSPPSARLLTFLSPRPEDSQITVAARLFCGLTSPETGSPLSSLGPRPGIAAPLLCRSFNATSLDQSFFASRSRRSIDSLC